jgi:hypothetical protein
VRNIVHRHLGKVVAGTAIAVAGTAVMIGITLPGTAGADDTGTRAGQSVPRETGGTAGDGPPGRGAGGRGGGTGRGAAGRGP